MAGSYLLHFCLIKISSRDKHLLVLQPISIYSHKKSKAPDPVFPSRWVNLVIPFLRGDERSRKVRAAHTGIKGVPAAKERTRDPRPSSSLGECTEMNVNPKLLSAEADKTNRKGLRLCFVSSLTIAVRLITVRTHSCCSLRLSSSSQSHLPHN